MEDKRFYVITAVSAVLSCDAVFVGGYQRFWGPCVDGYQWFWEPYSLRIV
jgi:hypothetical protein